MSPGARTIPAAIVFPTAAEIPNHMPRTLRSRPRPRAAAATESKLPLDAELPGVEDRSDGFGNCRVSETLRSFAMIMCVGEKASRKRRNWWLELFPGKIADERVLFAPAVSKYFAHADAGEVKWQTLTELAP